VGVDDTKRMSAVARFGSLLKINRPASLFSSRLARIAGWLIGSVLDFTIDDVCVLCRKPGTPEIPEGPGSCLVMPVRHRSVFGYVEITNHPVCGTCAARLPVALGPGGLGYQVGAYVVVSHGRAVFGGPEPQGAIDRRLPSGSPHGRPISVISPYMIDDNILKIMHLIKFSGYEALTGPVAKSILWAARTFDPVPGEGDVVVPVPMDSWGLKRRGFNQSERFARQIAAGLDLPVQTGYLTKTGRTRPQSRTRTEDRADNVRGAFTCPRTAVSELAGRRVLLVDDLVTTGATAAACASTLLEAGAGSITVICFGRAL
jgi:predicted amidophosphoribosyltransferase